MTTDRKFLVTALCLVLLSPVSCRREPPPPPLPAMDLDESALASHASIGPFKPRAARVITDNDSALAHKLRLIESARSSIRWSGWCRS